MAAEDARTPERSIPVDCIAGIVTLALLAAVLCLLTMVYFNPIMAALFLGLGDVGYLCFLTTATRRRAAAGER